MRKETNQICAREVTIDGRLGTGAKNKGFR
jgi:hypothetical protein